MKNQKYTVGIREKWIRWYEVEASSEQDAIKKVRESIERKEIGFQFQNVLPYNEHTAKITESIENIDEF